MKSLKELANLVGGTIIGSHDMMIKGIGGANNAPAGTITFAETVELHKIAEQSDASAIIVPTHISESKKSLIQVVNPRLAFAQIAHQFAPQPLYTGSVHPTSIIDFAAEVSMEVSIHAHAVIDAGAKIGPRTIIGPGAYIGKNAIIGADCEIHANVVIEADTRIGERVIIHGGSVLGSDGYGFVTTTEGHYKVPQLGNVIIEDDVEIGANVTIDRGTIGATRVGQGTKIDNLVHLAHNVEIGPHSLVVAQVGVAGSAKVGSWVTLGGQAGVFGHLEVGDKVVLAARGVITNDVKSGAFLSGYPATDHREDFKVKAAARRLPEMVKQFRAMEKRLAQLEEKLKN